MQSKQNNPGDHANKNPGTEPDTGNTSIPAPLLRRVMAMVYDLLLLIALLFCTAGLYTMVAVALSGDPPPQQEVATGDVLTELQPVDLGFFILPLLAFVCIAFYTHFWRKDGQTLGMHAWKIKLVSSNGETPSYGQCLLRLLFANISFALLGLGYFYMLFDKDNKTWHDRLSKTEVLWLK